MTHLYALSRILGMNVPVFTKGDAATQLGIPVGNASVVLARLATSSQVLRLRRGVWAIKERYFTPLGTVSIHHVQPSFYFGFRAAGHAGGQLAAPEKALVDFLYLAPARSKLFRALPELEWPSGFSVRIARSIVKRIAPQKRRRIVERKLEELLQTRSSRDRHS